MDKALNGKQRARFRAQANHLTALFQVGKEGPTQAVADGMNDALRTRELLKGKVLLESCPLAPWETAERLAALAGAQVVQVVGGSMIFFKENPELRAKQAAEERRRKEARKKEKPTRAKKPAARQSAPARTERPAAKAGAKGGRAWLKSEKKQ